MIIQDVGQLRLDGRAKFVRQLLFLPASLTFFVSQPSEEGRIKTLLGKSRLIERSAPTIFKSESIATSYGTMLISDPFDANSKAYYLTIHGYVRVPIETAVEAVAVMVTQMEWVAWFAAQAKQA